MRCLMRLLVVGILGASGPGLAADESNTDDEFDDEAVEAEVEAPKSRERATRRKDKDKGTGKDGAKFAAGVGVGSPDALPVELIWRASKKLGVRAFVAPPVNVSASIYLPSQSVAQVAGYNLVTEPKTVSMLVEYGPNIGLEGMYYPWDGLFFVSGGISYRRVRISGSDSARLIICPASNPNCATANTPTDAGGSADSATLRLVVDAEAESSSTLGRFACGWTWLIGRSAYVTLTGIGIAVPLGKQTDIGVDGEIEGVPAWAQVALKSTLDGMEAQAEEDGEGAVADEIAPYESMMLPVAGISVGWRF